MSKKKANKNLAIAEYLYYKYCIPLMNLALKKFKKCNNVRSSDHEEAIMWILDKLEYCGYMSRYSGKLSQENLRCTLNNMISAGLA